MNNGIEGKRDVYRDTVDMYTGIEGYRHRGTEGYGDMGIEG